MNTYTTLNQVNHLNMSGKYKVVTTQDIINKFTLKGYQVSKYIETRPKKHSKIGYQKHMVRLTNPSLGLLQVGDSRPEILLKNSYDGSTSLVLSLGIYRLVCSNGLVVGNSFVEYRIRHDDAMIFVKIDQAIDALQQDIKKLEVWLNRFNATKLTQEQIESFSTQAAKLVLPENVLQFDTSRVNRARRTADQGNSLWLTFNRIQETCVNGGIGYTSQKTDSQGNVSTIYNTTRRIKSIDRLYEVNKKLWDIAESMAA